jgi:hypothetical protein
MWEIVFRALLADAIGRRDEDVRKEAGLRWRNVRKPATHGGLNLFKGRYHLPDSIFETTDSTSVKCIFMLPWTDPLKVVSPQTSC